MNLKTYFDGLNLDNPLMPASGPLVGDFEKLKFMKDSNCGAVVTKTISSKLPKIPKPCIYGEKTYVMNSELWSEYSYQTWEEEILPKYMKIKDRPLIISLGYTKEDMELLVPIFDPFADAFEISTHYVGTDLNVIKETVLTIRKHTSKPVYMKISPHLPDPKGFAKVIKENGASGIVAINSLGPTMKINIEKRRIDYGNEQGFVWTSGPAIKNLALATVYQIKQAEPTLTVIGVGGIQSAEDVIEFLLAGASGVQMLSGALLKGKDLYRKIIEDLPKALSKFGFKSVMDVINTSLTKDVKYDANVPRLIPDLCIKCNICVQVCPYFSIEMKDQITFLEDKCFKCGLCVVKCPTKAIMMDE